ncbi:putative nuclease HARBI1 [Merluccius polli]|uniref:Nuclease HARBI1 n=1 Tax=Merluccius polli TaxID=89951 RepID=A0AA47N394_MERPO|nr:putative nuclease HARBI1 [Merluccius polli]
MYHSRVERPLAGYLSRYVASRVSAFPPLVWFGSYNLTFQMICDADCLISNVEAKWPGSVHDSRIFRASPIYEGLSQGAFSGVLLGDKGYACESFLLTPLSDPQTPAQQAYNHAHNKTRARIEMTFGLLKSRFQCLHHLRVSPDRACDVFAACAVLHNIAGLKRRDPPRVAVDVDWENAPIFPDNVNGRLAREQYIARYFT